ncbi:MAG: TlpA disulfide reductase family protein [Bacteroidia bacterium]
MIKRSLFSALFLIILLAGSGYFFYKRYNVAPAIKYNDIIAKNLDGSNYEFVTDDNSQKIVLFFATWCIDCRRELPELQKLTDLLKELQIEVLLISDEDEDTIKRFAVNIQEPFKMLKLQGSFKQSGIYTLPTAYLYCKNGRVHLQKTGAINWTPEYLRAYSQACK